MMGVLSPDRVCLSLSDLGLKFWTLLKYLLDFLVELINLTAKLLIFRDFRIEIRVKLWDIFKFRVYLIEESCMEIAVDVIEFILLRVIYAKHWEATIAVDVWLHLDPHLHLIGMLQIVVFKLIFPHLRCRMLLTN